MAMTEGRRKTNLKSQLFGGRLQVPCCFCERPLFFRRATLEHVIPMAQGGTWALANLAISCDTCNNARGTRDFDTFKQETRAKMAEQREAPPPERVDARVGVAR